MNNHKSPEAIEIERYLRIIDGSSERTVRVTESDHVNTTIYFGNVKIDDILLYEDGTRWIKIVEDQDFDWVVDHGYIGNPSEGRIIVEKAEVSSMIRDNILYKDNSKTVSPLLESDTAVTKFDIFLEKIDRYLLRNYQTDNTAYNTDWKSLYESGCLPCNAAEYARHDN